MLPQSDVLILAPIAGGRADELRALLEQLNRKPGLADPMNPLVPFGAFERLHVARVMILADPTPEDIGVYGLAPASFPPGLALFADCDGTTDGFLVELAHRAEPGLRRIFSCCVGFGANTDVLQFMRQHLQPSAAAYANWVGRTVRQIREEAALREALTGYLDANASQMVNDAPAEVHRRLTGFVKAQVEAGSLTFTPPEPTPTGWRFRNLLHLVGVPVVLLLASPFLLLYSPFFFWKLRQYEKNDPEILPRPEPERRAGIAAREDHDVANPYIVCGYLKPGLFRLSIAIFLLWLVDYGARHIYNRGHIARVQTIHFARWVFLNDRKQMFFASNYDGALESYMDDFINKVGWGLNLLFSNGVGYPRTNWLIQGGAANEQKFKYFIHRHQIPVQVWYKAYPGLTAFDLLRNARLREGLERPSMTDSEIREWLALL
jgi:hypothetical protein